MIFQIHQNGLFKIWETMILQSQVEMGSFIGWLWCNAIVQFIGVCAQTWIMGAAWSQADAEYSHKYEKMVKYRVRTPISTGINRTDNVGLIICFSHFSLFFFWDMFMTHPVSGVTFIHQFSFFIYNYWFKAHV